MFLGSRRRWGCAVLLVAVTLAFAAWSGRERPPETGHAIPLDRLLVRGDPAGAAACATCHDDGNRREIVQEWLRTEVSETRDCASCHPAGSGERPHCKPSPPGFTASVRFLTEAPNIAGKLVVTNVGAGHRLPSYADTELRLSIEQIDRAGLPLPETSREGFVGRRIVGDADIFDTRLLPGEVHTLPYITTIHPDARALRARVTRLPAQTVAWEEIARLAEP